MAPTSSAYPPATGPEGRPNGNIVDERGRHGHRMKAEFTACS